MNYSLFHRLVGVKADLINRNAVQGMWNLTLDSLDSLDLIHAGRRAETDLAVLRQASKTLLPSPTCVSFTEGRRRLVLGHGYIQDSFSDTARGREKKTNNNISPLKLPGLVQSNTLVDSEYLVQIF
jgi:hypothetical protein